MATGAVEKAAQLLRSRIEEIEDERGQLEKALASLGSNSAPRHAATPPAPKRRRRGKRAKRGQREAEFLAYLEAKPGSTIAQAAAAIGVASTQLYPIARKLEAANKIKQSGNGFELSASADSGS